MQSLVELPNTPGRPRVAIVGAGLGGLVCARDLARAGCAVTVFDKARGPGGRCSTRRVPAQTGVHAELHFDHGAQYFTVRDPALAAFVERGRQAGQIATWEPRLWAFDDGAGHAGARASAGPAAPGPTRYVGVPGMSAVAKCLVAELEGPEVDGQVELRLGTRVARVAREKFDWELLDADGQWHTKFGFVVLNLPPEQAAPLLAGHAERLRERAQACVMEPCWTVMLGLERPLGLDFDAAFVNRAPLAWIADNASKPGRPPAPAWVLQASGAWSSAKLELTPEDAARELLANFAGLIGRRVEPRFVVSHLWRYAKPEPLPEPYLIDRLGIGACGDWCGGPRVEGAFVSGRALAAAILAR